MKERVATAVDRIDAAAQIVPIADLVHGLIADDLFQDVGRRRPVDFAQHQKSPVEPGRRADARRRGRARRARLSPFIRSSRSARIATRSAVPPGARLSRRINSCRRGSEAKCRAPPLPSPGSATQASMALLTLSRSGPNLCASVWKKARRSAGIEIAIAIENFAAPSRYRRLRRGLTIALRRARSGRRRPACRRTAYAVEQRSPALGNRVVSRSEKNALFMVGRSNPSGCGGCYLEFKAKRAPIKRMTEGRK